MRGAGGRGGAEIERQRETEGQRKTEIEREGAHPTLGIASALENKSAAAAFREAAHGGADEVSHSLEEALVLPRVPKNGEKVLLRAGNTKHDTNTRCWARKK